MTHRSRVTRIPVLRVFALLAALFAFPALFACAPGPRPAEPKTLTILYTTDAHGHIVTGKTTIGLDTVAAVKKSLPGSVLLDAGDFLHGTPLTLVDKGRSVVAFMRAAGYDAAAAGNHEFSQGREALLARRAEAEQGPDPMPILSANILAADGSPFLTPYTRLDADGTALCVFGLTTTRTQTLPSTVAGLTFADPAVTARALAARLRASGCDLVLALVHLGSDSHMGFTSKDLAAAVPGLHAVIDGHSHRELDVTVNGIPVVSSGAHGKALGKLVLTLDGKTKAVLAVHNTLLRPGDVKDAVPDPELAAAITALQKDVADRLSEVVAHSAHALPGDRARMRTRETALGNLAADAVRHGYKTETAVVNGGGVRSGLPRGPVARKDVLAIFPFSGYAISMRVSGRELLDILEHAVAGLPDASGAFPQVSGISMTVSPDAPAGKRIGDARINGAPLDDKRIYTLAVNDFLAQGGDGYPHLSGKARLQTWLSMEDAFIGYVREKGVPSPASVGNRIRIK